MYAIFSIVLLTFLSSSLAEDIQVSNNCGTRLLVKNEGGNTGQFFLENGQSRTFQVNAGDPRPRVWAHKGCDGNGNNCDTREGQVSLAEMHWDAAGNRKTWYDISHVDGYNLPITMQPFNPNAGGRCETVGCNFNLNNCPSDARVYKNGRLVACQNTNRDSPNTNYVRALKQACPNSYTWSKDDSAGMRDCQNNNRGLRVIFC
jgi:hypothetical protein